MQKKNVLNRNYNKIVFGILTSVVLSMGMMMTTGITKILAQANPAMPPVSQASNSSMPNMNMSSSAATNKTTVTRDSVALLLDGKAIPAKGFIHLYDSTPYMINNGHIALHVPCDASSKPVVNVLIGSAPDLKTIEPEVIKELSQPGNMCLYHVDVGSDLAKKIIQTDIAIQNPSDKVITFPASSGIVIGINEIMPGAP